MVPTVQAFARADARQAQAQGAEATIGQGAERALDYTNELIQTLDCGRTSSSGNTLTAGKSFP